MDTIQCCFDITSMFIENEIECYITPINNHTKIMKKFNDSYTMIQFMKEKNFVYDPEKCIYIKNNNIYILWIIVNI